MECIDPKNKVNIEPPLADRLSKVRHISESNGVLYLLSENRVLIAVLQRPSGYAGPKQPTVGSDTGTITGAVAFAGPLVAHVLSRGSVSFARQPAPPRPEPPAKTSIKPDGTFSINLPAGTYLVSATSPEFTFNGVEGVCYAAKPVHVARYETSSVTVYCNNK
jgi:hypothetical protein